MENFEDERLATDVQYLPSDRRIEINLDDGSSFFIPIDSLEMLNWTGKDWQPAKRPSDEELADVVVWGGGASVYFPKIEQIFAVDELIDGIYGRPAWMESLKVIFAVV